MVLPPAAFLVFATEHCYFISKMTNNLAVNFKHQDLSHSFNITTYEFVTTVRDK